MRLREFVVSAREALSHLYPPAEAAAIVDVLCRDCFGVAPYAHIVSPSLEPEPSSMERAQSLLSRLAGGEPLQYVLGYTEFCGRRFNVNSAVLIPRPETELLCSEAITYLESRVKERHKMRVLDLCTGSGCIAWTLALAVPEAEVVAVDISREAIAVASSQPFDKSVSPRFLCADILDDDALQNVLGTGRFDLIVSNPPYILESEKAAMRPNVLDNEPSLALFVPDADFMVFNKKIAEICKKYLYTDAVGYIEINERLGNAVKLFFEENGFKPATLIKDLSGRDRFLKFQIQ